MDRFRIHKIEQRTYDLLDMASKKPSLFGEGKKLNLNKLDQQITGILLSAERHYSKKHINRDPWSPHQQLLGQTISYWKQKLAMYQRRIFHWPHLDRLRLHLNISDDDHTSTSLESIVTYL